MLPVKGLSLAEELWEPANLNVVVLAFLKAEWNEYTEDIKIQYSKIIESPTLGDVNEDRIRSQLLAARRGPLLSHIPSNTSWFMVSHLRRQHFSELLVINHSHWTSSEDRNELLKVVSRRPEPLKSHPRSWATPILWGHSKAGPFTILEGNHRLTALASSAETLEYPLVAYIGLAQSKCHWHLPDHEQSG